MTKFDDLMRHTRETLALEAVSGRTEWDQETMMPRGAAAQRGEELAALERVIHARRAAPEVGEWLSAIAEAEGEEAKAQLRHIRRRYDRATKVPADLAARLAQVTSVAQGEWAQARAADDFAAFAPRLAEVVDLRRQEAAALRPGADPYEALLDDYEPGATYAEIHDMFAALRPRLVALREAILGASHRPAPLSGAFDEAGQMAVSEKLALAFGYDLQFGRIDKAVHPFSSGSGPDVRITTRTVADDPFNCFYSTIHEVGHAGYEQNIRKDYALTPLGRGVSMGVHESQSRIYENQLGRSRAFCGYLFGQMQAQFGSFAPGEAQAFYEAVNRVNPGYIRTEADEVHYNLHVMLRFDLEAQLIRGELAVADLEEAWNSRFAADFGVEVDRAANGVLQDVH
ncbi:MAG: carboxypeptidase M32, partial [Mangrovicoccus sp.]